MSGFRSLADQLRGWSDERLARLLLARPDLTTPAPHDVGQLASRATVRASLSRALDTLTRLEISVADALVVAGQTTRAEVQSIIHAAPAAVDAALDRLLDLALAWEPDGIRAVTGLSDALAGGPGTSGLRPASAEPLSPAQVRRLVGRADAAGRGAAAARGGARRRGDVGHGPADRAARRGADPGRGAARPAAAGATARWRRGAWWRPARWAGAAGRAHDGGAGRRPPRPWRPPSAIPALVDRTAAGAAFESVRRLELLLDHWGGDPPAVLRSGGLAVRDLKAAADLLGVDGPTAALLIETAAGAGLLASRADASGAQVWVPTDEFDTWTGLDPAERWVRLARAWLASARLPSLVGSRDPAGKTWNALAPELTSHLVAESREMTLAALADLAPGASLAAGTGLPSLLEVVAWRRPRRPRSRTDQVDVDRVRGRRPRAHRPRRARVVREGPDRRRRPGARPGGAAARARRPRAGAGGPDRGGARAAGGVAGAPARAGGGGGVARRCHRLPVHAGLGAARARRRLDRRRAARVPGHRVADAGAAAAHLPGRRHGADLRHAPGRPGGVLPARRRRGAALRAARPPTGGLARAAAAGADRGGVDDAARRAAAAAARPRRRGGGGVTRRHDAGAPARPAAGAGAPRPPGRARRCPRPRRRPGGVGGDGDPRRRPCRPHPPRRHRPLPQRRPDRAALRTRGGHHRGHRLPRQPRRLLRPRGRPAVGRGRPAASPTTTAPTTSAPSPSTGSRACGGSRAEARARP